METHPSSTTRAWAPGCGPLVSAILLEGPLGGEDEDTLTLLPYGDLSCAIVIGKRDVVAFDTLPSEGVCRVVVFSDATIEERRTISVTSTAGECAWIRGNGRPATLRPQGGRRDLRTAESNSPAGHPAAPDPADERSGAARRGTTPP